MKNKIRIILSLICLLIIPTQIYAMTENSVGYIVSGEIGEVSSAQVTINNLYGDLQAGEYFTINLIGAEFEFDSSGNPNISSYNVAFDKRTKTSVTGKLLDNVVGRGTIGINFSSKILSNEAIIEIEGDDSHITDGRYTYAITPESEISRKGQVELRKESPFYDLLDLGTIIIKETNNSAFRSLMIYEYDKPELIKLEVPKGDYKFHQLDYSKPITFVIEDQDGNERSYELGKDQEVYMNPKENILTFSKYDHDIALHISGKYTVKIKNLGLKAIKTNQEKDAYLSLGGKWLEEEDILIGKQVRDELVFQASLEEMALGQDQRVQFVLQEGKGNTLLTTSQLSFAITGGAKVNFKDDFKLTLVDGTTKYDQNQAEFKIKENDDSFTISNFKRENKSNLIRIEGEFTAKLPSKVEENIRLFVSDPAVGGVLDATVFDGYEKYYMPKVAFTINEDTYTIDEETHLIDVKPYISVHNRIMVPLRYVAYTLGVDSDDLKWDGPTKTATLQGDQPMTISAETGQMIINGESSDLSEISLKGGRVFVPVGEIARAFGREVKWEPRTRTATFN